MTLLALSIFFFFFFLHHHLLATAAPAPTNTAKLPIATCLTVSAPIRNPRDCVSLLSNLNLRPLGLIPRPWGASGNISTQLPQTVAQYGDCELLLQLNSEWPSPTPNFALADYDEDFLQIYYGCVQGGTRRGGKVLIGPDLEVMATIWSGRLLVPMGGAEGGRNGTVMENASGAVGSVAVA